MTTLPPRSPFTPSVWSPLALALGLCLWPVVIKATEIPLVPAESAIRFTGHATLHNFDGEARASRGAAEFDPQTPEAISGATLVVRAADLTTFQATRDRNMRNWLEVEKFPEIRFELSRVRVQQGQPRAATEAQPASFKVSGKLTLHNVTRPLEADVKGWRAGRKLVVQGETGVDTTAYGLPIIRQFVLTVDPKVDLHVRLVFELPAAFGERTPSAVTDR